MESNNLKHLSAGQPTYWPSDRSKLQAVVDFCVTEDIPQDFSVTESCFDLSSDHFPVLMILTVDLLNQENEPSLSNRHTYILGCFRCLVNER
jgi:hypothetical protein